MRMVIVMIGGLAMAASTAAAQTGAATAAIAAAFETVSGHLLTAAERVPAEQYEFRPVDGVRTFLQLVAHVADGNDYYCRHAGGDRVEWDTPAERTATTREDAIDALRRSVERCRTAFAAAEADPAASAEGLAHANLHYGNVIVYLRMMGIVPPSS